MEKKKVFGRKGWQGPGQLWLSNYASSMWQDPSSLEHPYRKRTLVVGSWYVCALIRGWQVDIQVLWATRLIGYCVMLIVYTLLPFHLGCVQIGILFWSLLQTNSNLTCSSALLPSLLSQWMIRPFAKMRRLNSWWLIIRGHIIYISSY